MDKSNIQNLDFLLLHFCILLLELFYNMYLYNLLFHFYNMCHYSLLFHFYNMCLYMELVHYYIFQFLHFYNMLHMLYERYH